MNFIKLEKRLSFVPQVWDDFTQSQYENIFHDMMCGGRMRVTAKQEMIEFYKNHKFEVFIRRFCMCLILPDMMFYYHILKRLLRKK